MKRRFLQEGSLGRVWATRLLPGDDLTRGIIQVMQEARVERAVVVSAVGSLRDVVLRAAKQGARLPITPEQTNTVELPGRLRLSCVSAGLSQVPAPPQAPGRATRMSGPVERGRASPFELLNLEGIIVPGEEGPFCHLHPTLGAEDGSVWGGHLLQGTVFSTVELVLGELVGFTVVKRHTEETGLAELEPD